MTNVQDQSSNRLDSSSWTTVKLGDVVSHLQEIERKAEEAGLERFLKVEHFDTERLTIDRWGEIAEEDLPPTFYKVFRAGQILYPTRNPHLRRTAVASFDGICGEKTLTLQSNGNINSQLLPYIFQTEAFIDYATSMSIGSTNPHVRWRDIAAYQFAIPDSNTQLIIAKILRASDDVIELYAKARVHCEKALSTIRASLFSQAAKTYRLVPLREAGNWCSGGTPSKNNREYWGGDFPWISPKDMKSDVIEGTIDGLTEAALTDRVIRIPQDSILIVVRGMILAHSFPIALTGCEATFNQDMRALVPSVDFAPLFLFHWFHWHKRRLLNLVTETTHGTKRLPTDILHCESVPKPPLSDQEEIVCKLEAFRQHVNDLNIHIERCTSFKRSILNNLFSGNINDV